jgi:hypothetical protein
VLKSLLLAVGLGVIAMNAYSESRGRCESLDSCVFIVDGAVNQQALSVLQNLHEKSKGKGDLTVLLNSAGGDPRIAMRIGRLIRKWSDSATYVVPDGKCFSACVFVFGAGLSRSMIGQIGIHRPYTASQQTAQRYADRQEEFTRLEGDVKAYLREINVDPSLYDAMMSVGPEKMHVLTKEEAARFRLTGRDVVAQDLANSQEAARFGVTTSVYFQLRKMSATVCEGFPDLSLLMSDSELYSALFSVCRDTAIRHYAKILKDVSTPKK